MTVSDLEETIDIEFPVSDDLPTDFTYGCGSTTSLATAITQDGITTTIEDDHVVCSATHATEFVVEMHEALEDDLADAELF